MRMDGDLHEGPEDRARRDQKVAAINALGEGDVAVIKAAKGGEAAVISAKRNGTAGIIKAVTEAIGPAATKLIRGAAAMFGLCLVFWAGQYVLKAYNALFTSGEAPQAVSHTRNLVSQATSGETPEVALRRQLAAVTAERDQLKAHSENASSNNEAGMRCAGSLSACEAERNACQLDRDAYRSQRDTCVNGINERVVGYWNRHIREFCPSAPQVQLTSAPSTDTNTGGLHFTDTRPVRFGN